MLYKGTTARSGSGHGIVVRTGMDTELGRISALVESAEDEQTPLEKRLNALANRLIWVTIAIAVVNAIAGIVSGRELILMIETSLALAVAAIPEGLPIVATIALARGMWRMARRNALVSRLSAVETLGATNVICTDKTGTVTENRMTVTRVDLADRTGGFVERGVEAASGDETRGGLGDVVGEAIRVGMLCSNASINDERNQRIGDPLEVAILAAGRERGMSRPELLKDYKEVREVAFDPEVKMMATYHRNPEGGVFVAVKGAPEAVMHASSHIRADGESVELDETGRDAIVRRNAELAGEGLRLIAVARKQVQSEEAEPYENLEFLGILGLLDPPRGDVEKAIGLCRHAGIRVIMVTGDQHLTAVHVARAVGIVDDVETGAVHGRRLADASTADETTRQELVRATVFSQVSPKQKLDLIQLHQDTGSVVAMTGDGVNDAPALKKADIGVAMGQRGTEVARESADMVLQDDAFSTITAAIQQGRVIFANIRKFVVYLLSGNISQIMTVGVASVLVLPLPILPLQILFLNLVNDVFPAFALGVGQGSRDVMERPARDPGEPVLTGAHWGWMVGYAALIAAAVMASLTIATRYLGLPGDEAVTISFLTLAFARLWHVFNMRRGTEGMLRNEITRNPYVWGAIALCVLLLGLTPYLPGLSNVLSVNPPGLSGWAVILPASLLPTVIGQLVLAVLGPRRRTPDL
jgi:Ca2+-transporting ATPase